MGTKRNEEGVNENDIPQGVLEIANKYIDLLDALKEKYAAEIAILTKARKLTPEKTAEIYGRYERDAAPIIDALVDLENSVENHLPNKT